MLGGMQAIEQRLLRVIGRYRDSTLRNDRAAVERRIDEMHGHAGHAHPRGERLAHRMRARK